MNILLPSRSAFSHSRYNRLQSVEFADNALKDKDLKSDFLEAASILLHKYSLERRLGIGLLHKHNIIEAHECMTEFPMTIDDEEVLVTLPDAKRVTETRSVPVLWDEALGNYYPIEFSADPLAVQLYQDGVVSSEFLEDFSRLRASRSIGKYFGLAIVQRDFYLRKVDDESLAMEKSNIIDRHNIVYARKHELIKDYIIETAWSFEEFYDVRLGCKTKVGCERYCRKICGGNDHHTWRHKPYEKHYDWDELTKETLENPALPRENSAVITGLDWCDGR